jgi:hypothetical protein
MHEPGASWMPGVWRTPEGGAVSCVEKNKVMNENICEIHQMCQDALEDGVLMGCEEEHIRAVLHRMIDVLVNPYRGRT